MNPRRTAPRGSEGFTLVELTVALLAGLIVAMAIVGLSRQATNTFHEEARSSAAEASLRTAIDRLRADIERAGYMSTGNLLADPQIAHPLGQGNVPASPPAIFSTLMSVSWTPHGSYTNNGLALADVQPNPARPDLIQIGGNMTTADAFDVASIAAQTGCTRIYLSPNSAAVFRVVGFVSAANATPQELHNVFFPSQGAPGQYQFLVRLVDVNQCTQFLTTCKNSAQVAGLEAGTNLPYVDVNPTPAIVTANTTGGSCGIAGYGEGSKVNPVQVVRWEITTQASSGDPEPAQYLSGLGNPTAAAGKYDLMRSYVDANGVVVPDTSEIVAEYAVDLAFAFSVDKGTATNPSIVTYAFDDTGDNSPYAASPYLAIGPGPQRIRSVRVRLVTRTALPDRSANILPTAFGEVFTYRYCVLSAGCASNPNGTLEWARTRTITTEIALPNQAENFY